MTITTRSGKGSALTNTELDANFTHLGGDGSYQAPSTKGTAGQVLRMNSGATALEFGTVSGGGGGISDLVDDTTPQLGGALDTNGNNITFSDNAKARFGAGNDLEIYHDATDNHIDYSSKLTFTPSGGADITFNGTSYDTDWMALGHWHFKDGTEARFGNSDDLKIYHSGTESIIKDGGTGTLKTLSNAYYIKNVADSTTSAYFDTVGAVNLYYNGAKKFETTSTGIKTTGTVSVNNAYTLPTADGTNGQVLTTDGSGAVTFATPSGGGGSSGQSITTITSNTTLSNSDKGKLIQTETSGITITIPALSGLDADWFVDIETLNTNTFNHGKVTIDITTNNSGASINRSGNATMYGGNRIRLARSPAGGDSDGQLNAYQSTMLTGSIVVREDRLAGGLQGGDVGVGSIAIGNANNASGNDAVCIGQLGTASATGSVAIGSYNGASATVNATGNGAVALGSGLASGSRSFAAQITNSSSSYGATGSNSIAIGQTSKATGEGTVAIGKNCSSTGATNGSVAIGFNAEATARETVAIGSSAYATGSGAVALGGYFGTSVQARATGTSAFAVAGYNGLANRDSTAAGLSSIAMAGGYAQQNQSVAIGAFAHANVRGKVAWSSYPLTNSDGATQAGNYVLANSTTDATATKLVTDYEWTTPSSSNQVVLPNNSVYGFTGTVIARENSSSTNDFAVWEIKGGAVRAGSASTTALGSYNINRISESAGATNWSIALSADTTNGAVAITVTGEASHSIRWVATVNTTEVIY